MKIFFFSILFLVPFTVHAAKKRPEANIEKRPAPPAAAAQLVLTGDRPNFCIAGSQSGKAFHGEAAFKSIVWKSDVVYLGETHDQPLDHAAQLEALKAMKIARGYKIAVGFEMLSAKLQPVLDEYAAGRLTEADFLSRTDWKSEWGFDFSLYKPLFDFVIANKLRALALSVPKEVTARIAGAGLEGLTPGERQFLPEKVEITRHQKYNDYLKASFTEQGNSSTGKTAALDNYLASVAASNEGMGGRIAAFLAENPGYAVLVIAGNDRVIYNAAVPASVKSRIKGVRQASFFTEDAVECPVTMPKEHKDLANYIWYINHTPERAPAMPATSTATLAPSAPAAEPGK